MVGKSTCGNGATGRNGNATMPTKASADINRQVAIGRRMKGSEIFTMRSESSVRPMRRGHQSGAMGDRSRGIPHGGAAPVVLRRNLLRERVTEQALPSPDAVKNA